MEFINFTEGQIRTDLYICIMTFCRSQPIKTTLFFSKELRGMTRYFSLSKIKWYVSSWEPERPDGTSAQRHLQFQGFAASRDSADNVTCYRDELCQSNLEKNVTLEPLAAVCKGRWVLCISSESLSTQGLSLIVSAHVLSPWQQKCCGKMGLRNAWYSAGHEQGDHSQLHSDSSGGDCITVRS